MCSKVQMKGILILLCPEIIKKAAKKLHCREAVALDMFYSSRLYADLECEATKVWHYSSSKLADLLVEEIQTGRLNYPEEAS
jgi:hypothetical protein